MKKFWGILAGLAVLAAWLGGELGAQTTSINGQRVMRGLVGTPANGQLAAWNAATKQWEPLDALTSTTVHTNGSLTLWGIQADIGFTWTNNAAGNYRVTLPSAGLSGPVNLYVVGTNITVVAVTNEWVIPISDMTTALTTGTNKNYFYAPASGMTIKGVRLTLATASSSGTPTVDINEAGTTILSTKLTVDANEWDSVTAATAAVISDSAIAANAKVDFDIDVAGTGTAGAQVHILWTVP